MKSILIDLMLIWPTISYIWYSGHKLKLGLNWSAERDHFVLCLLWGLRKEEWVECNYYNGEVYAITQKRIEIHWIEGKSIQIRISNYIIKTIQVLSRRYIFDLIGKRNLMVNNLS